MLTINTSFVRILTGGCKTLVDERKLGQFWPHPDVNLGNVGLNVSSKKELKRLYLGRSLFGVADFNWHYRCRTYRGQDRLVAGKIPSTGCCPDYLPGSELERDRLRMCAATHLFLSSAAIFTTVQTSLCFHKPSAPELAAFSYLKP